MKDSVKYGIMGLLAVALLASVGYNFMNKKNAAPSGKVTKIQEGVPNSNTSAAVNNTASTANNTATNADNTAAAAATPEGTSAGLPKTSLNWSNMEHDFGSIQQDSENTHVFAFTNTGNEPLIIEKAKGSCGCTVPEYPKEPIAPGESSEIRVVYKPGKQKNNQTKKVTVTANTDPVQTILTIKANVEVPAGVQ